MKAVDIVDVRYIKNIIINEMEAKLKEHASYIVETGEDLDEIKKWEF